MPIPKIQFGFGTRNSKIKRNVILVLPVLQSLVSIELGTLTYNYNICVELNYIIISIEYTKLDREYKILHLLPLCYRGPKNIFYRLGPDRMPV
jgi:hypothetical protein